MAQTGRVLILFHSESPFFGVFLGLSSGVFGQKTGRNLAGRSLKNVCADGVGIVG